MMKQKNFDPSKASGVASKHLSNYYEELKNSCKELESTLLLLGLGKDELNPKSRKKLLEASNTLLEWEVEDVEPDSFLLKLVCQMNTKFKAQQFESDFDLLEKEVDNSLQILEKRNSLLLMNLKYSEMIINDFKKEHNIDKKIQLERKFKPRSLDPPASSWSDLNEIIKALEEINELENEESKLQEELQSYNGIPPDLVEANKVIQSAEKALRDLRGEYALVKSSFMRNEN